MNTQIQYATAKPTGSKLKIVAGIAAVVIVIGAIAADTKVVKIGSTHDVREQAFSPEAYGAQEFPKVLADVQQRAVDAVTLGNAILADKKAAGTKYGVATSTGPVLPVSLSGTFGDRKANLNDFKVDGLPDGITVRVQTGPAINGTDLRDATGKIQFGQFTNQIEYQDAGSAINNEMKKATLGSLDPEKLTGKTATVIGVFKLINPKNWLVTPVKVELK
jgi:predicted lipoprotein